MSTTPVNQPETLDPGGWAPYLDPGERLLWQGAPATGLRFRPADILLSLFGLFFAGFAIFWIVMASSIGGSGRGAFGVIFPLFGIPFVLVGLYLVVGRFFWASYARSKTRYALTDKRAIIARSALMRTLRSWPITEESPVEYQPGDEATIYFATETRRRSRHRSMRSGTGTGVTFSSSGGTYTVKIGFEYIPEGDHVYRLIRGIQQGEGADNA